MLEVGNILNLNISPTTDAVAHTPVLSMLASTTFVYSVEVSVQATPFIVNSTVLPSSKLFDATEFEINVAKTRQYLQNTFIT